MPAVLAVVLLAVPLIELWLIVQVADRVGLLETVGLLILVAFAGTWLLLREGRLTYANLRAAMARGEMPTNELIDGAILIVGGALLLTPGFFTDIVGLVLLVPVSRRPVKRLFRKLFSWWFVARFGRAGVAGKVVYETSAKRVRRRDAATDPTQTPASTLPSATRPSDEDGSPDRE